MKILRFPLAAAAALMVTLSASGASINSLPLKNINGTQYRIYEVQSKETVYSICHKFGITKDELVKYNPAVADGLKAGMTLYFPASGTTATPSQQIASGKTVTHTVQKGETIFGIARTYGLTPEQVIELNPAVNNGLKSGQVLRLVAEEAVKAEKPAKAEKTTASEQKGHAPEFKPYTVKKKETFYSIAVANGISVTQLEAANPGIASLTPGQVLNIPVVAEKQVAEAKAEEKPAAQVSETTIKAPEQTPVTPLPEVVKPTKKEPIGIAVVLPFMLNEENVGKSAQRYTEFYKGMLLAVDSLRESGTPVHVTAYDTEGSLERVKQIVANPALKHNTYIVAPDNAAQMALLAEFGRKNNVRVLNTFLVRDDSYLTNPAMMQGSIPSGDMYSKAINALAERLKYSTPIFVSVGDGDKADFTDEVKKVLAARGIAWRDIKVDNKLTKSALSDLAVDGNYTFIPTSSKQADLNRIMPAIIDWRDEAVTPTVRLFGYPEWTTFRGETLSNMHNLNTTVYSRFFAWEDSPRVTEIHDKFKRWYGADMESAVPRQGLLGFDTGMYLIKNSARQQQAAQGSALTTGSKELPVIVVDEHPVKYDGVQNGFNFVKSAAAAGRYNDFLYLINFRPGNTVEKSQI